MELIVFIASFVPLWTDSHKIYVLDYSGMLKSPADIKLFIAACECLFGFWLVF
jgi:hypothetical protein